MKNRTKSILSIVLALIMMLSIATPASYAFAATTYGYITSASNTSTGIKINWKKDSGKTGYYIYRKPNSSSKWAKIKTVKGTSTTTWTDTKAENNKKYDYRVYSYKGSKTYTNTKTKTIYRILTPKITSIGYKDNNIRIVSDTNANISGYVIKYSKNKDFSNSTETSIYTGAKKLDTVICNLACSTQYYFKIRAYKKSGDTKYYSGYSSYKVYTTKPSYTAYTTGLNTSIYSSASTSSTKTVIQYMSQVKIYQDVKISSTGKWIKLKYNDKYYYAWIDNGEEKFTKTKNPYTYDLSMCNPYQKEIVEKALYIFKNQKTEYDTDKIASNGEKNPKTGKYPYDCSGLVRYVHNDVMNKYTKGYQIPWSIEDLYSTRVIYNNGFESEFSATEVCTGKLDYSKLQPGDVLFFKLTKSLSQKKIVNHCAIYLGDKQFIHSSPGYEGVAITPIMGVYEEEFVKAIRYIPSTVEDINKDIIVKCIDSGAISVYSIPKFEVAYRDCRIPNGTTVKLITMNSTYAYIQYLDSDKNIKYGYVYKPLDKLSGIYD